MITNKQVEDVLTALGDEFIVDIPADHTHGYKLDYNTLVTFLINPPQDFVDRITGYVNTRT